MSRRKALLIGIDDYPGKAKLNGCLSDVSSLKDVLSFNEDGTQNFDIVEMLDVRSSHEAMVQIESLFSTDSEIALFYFSGHGFNNITGSEIVFPDDLLHNGYYKGLQMRSIMEIVNQSKSKNKVIILDCCHAGDLGRYRIDIDNSDLGSGVSILTACKGDESAMVQGGHSIFTSALCFALSGPAADFSGNVTMGSLYGYVERFFSAGEQRPVFKTNVSEFVTLRKVKSKVSDNTLKEIVSLFPKLSDQIQLDPSFEFSNSEGNQPKLIEPFANPENVEKMKTLQALARIGFVEPVGEEHMYYAAMNSKPCKLTLLGTYYWLLVKKGVL
jgi:hypothetical protein